MSLCWRAGLSMGQQLGQAHLKEKLLHDSEGRFEKGRCILMVEHFQFVLGLLVQIESVLEELCRVDPAVIPLLLSDKREPRDKA